MQATSNGTQSMHQTEETSGTGVEGLFRRDRIWFEDPLRLIPRALTALYSAWVKATYPFASIGRGVSIHYTWDFRRYLARRVKIGNEVLIRKDVHFGVSHPEALQEGEPVIILGDNCAIHRRAQISARNCIHLEQGVIVSASVLIMDHNHAFDDVTRPIREQGITEGGTIRIGQGCWIGHGAAILCKSGELVLGRNCVVGANAVVTRSFPPYSVIVGNPARVVRRYDTAKQSWQTEVQESSLKAGRA